MKTYAWIFLAWALALTLTADPSIDRPKVQVPSQSPSLPFRPFLPGDYIDQFRVVAVNADEQQERADVRLQDMICMAGSRGDRECK